MPKFKPYSKQDKGAKVNPFAKGDKKKPKGKKKK
jgi:hypothetical protein